MTNDSDEIAAAGSGLWSVRFNDSTPVKIRVPRGSNLREVIERRWPGISNSSVAISADPL